MTITTFGLAGSANTTEPTVRSKVAVSSERIGLLRLLACSESRLQVCHDLLRAGIVRQILQLVRVGLIIVELRAFLAVVPFGVAIALGADAAAHEPRRIFRFVACGRRRAARDLRERRM